MILVVLNGMYVCITVAIGVEWCLLVLLLMLNGVVIGVEHYQYKSTPQTYKHTHNQNKRQGRTPPLTPPQLTPNNTIRAINTGQVRWCLPCPVVRVSLCGRRAHRHAHTRRIFHD